MEQILSKIPISRIAAVNVASVPQRSLLRYPGGKTWLVPHIREWLRQYRPKTLIEPFAGGGIVSLTAVMEDFVKNVFMIELDRDVAAFWRAALYHGPELRERVMRFKPTFETIRRLESKPPATVVDHALRTLVLNRTRRGGILAPGASMLKNGENGKGIHSRWYPETLASRLDTIIEFVDRITFLEGDGLKFLPVILENHGKRTALFLDPPYTAHGGKRAGSRLYVHSDIDHAHLFSILAECKCNFLMTYDPAPEIIELAHAYRFSMALVSMKSCHHRVTSEILITRHAIFE